MGEWIKWEGGECPVSDDTVVDVKFREGGDPDRACAGTYYWPHDNDSSDIVAYRVVGQAETSESALARQEGGDHYKSMAIQPVEFIHRNGIGFCEGAVIKYVSRWRAKNGVEDLKKARHFLDLLIEMEEAPRG